MNESYFQERTHLQMNACVRGVHGVLQVLGVQVREVCEERGVLQVREAAGECGCRCERYVAAGSGGGGV